VETDENLLSGNTAGVTDEVVASGFVAGCMDVVNNVMYTTTGTHIYKDGVDAHTSPFTIQTMISFQSRPLLYRRHQDRDI